ncbi:heme/hemin ABC transporter substrate-binding protein [Parapedobacter koreensis]|uniref:Iron complex transport system substrate-binding protein n=1 Tax=Parapedobacter koreensis TaxID=332977 RepID=A0A1H7JTP1_9SPHI|nr:ABC transporter substrate-binding protein [Parapedobacter koreensis]SEK76865.1 iron complex transport system substrate-binding protein [Parapedobacter koreensis]
MKTALYFLVLWAALLITHGTYGQPRRIVSLSGALSETIDALGLGDRLVAVDVTSEYPAYVKKLPRVSEDRTVPLEGLLAFRPDLVLAPTGDLAPDVERRLKQLGIKLVTLRQEYSPNGAVRFVRDVAGALGVPEKGDALARELKQDLESALQKRKIPQKRTKVLFIYAQGVGLMSVAGKGSSIDAIIELAGGRNAIQEFSDFKPYSTEALVKANPDAILLFDFGLSSLGGPAAVLRMPGISLTTAGKSKRIIEMDGPLLVNFGTRLPQALTALNRALCP